MASGSERALLPAHDDIVWHRPGGRPSLGIATGRLVPDRHPAPPGGRGGIGRSRVEAVQAFGRGGATTTAPGAIPGRDSVEPPDHPAPDDAAAGGPIGWDADQPGCLDRAPAGDRARCRVLLRLRRRAPGDRRRAVPGVHAAGPCGWGTGSAKRAVQPLRRPSRPSGRLRVDHGRLCRPRHRPGVRLDDALGRLRDGPASRGLDRVHLSSAERTQRGGRERGAALPLVRSDDALLLVPVVVWCGGAAWILLASGVLTPIAALLVAAAGPVARRRGARRLARGNVSA